MKGKELLQRCVEALESGNEPYFDAEEFCDMLDYIEASEDFTYYDLVLALALRLHPHDDALLIFKCKQYIDNAKYDKALELLNQLKQADSQDRDALLMQCYCCMKKYDKAVEIMDLRIKQKVPYIEDLFEFVAPILNDLDMHQQAHSFINKGLKFFPDSDILNEELCFALEAEGNFKEAIAVCNRLIDKNPFAYNYWFSLGRLYSLDNNYEKAIEAFDFALACDDSDIDLKQLRAYCLVANGNYQLAVTAYLDIIESCSPDDQDTLLQAKQMLGECYTRQRQYEDGYKVLKEALKNPQGLDDGAHAFTSFICCCVETEWNEEAYITLKKAIKLYPDDLQLQIVHSLLIMARKSELMSNLVNMLLESMVGSAPDLENYALSSCLSDADLNGIEYLRKGEAQKALLYFQKLAKKHPDMPFLHIHLATAYALLNQSNNSQTELQKVTFDELEEYIRQLRILDEDEGEKEEDDGTSTSGQQLSNRDWPTIHFVEPSTLAKEYLINRENKN